MFGALDQSDQSDNVRPVGHAVESTSRLRSARTTCYRILAVPAQRAFFRRVSQNGIGITYHSGTVNNPGNFPNHGSSSTPTTVTYNTGTLRTRPARFMAARHDAHCGNTWNGVARSRQYASIFRSRRNQCTMARTFGLYVRRIGRLVRLPSACGASSEHHHLSFLQRR